MHRQTACVKRHTHTHTLEGEKEYVVTHSNTLKTTVAYSACRALSGCVLQSHLHRRISRISRMLYALFLSLTVFLCVTFHPPAGTSSHVVLWAVDPLLCATTSQALVRGCECAHVCVWVRVTFMPILWPVSLIVALCISLIVALCIPPLSYHHHS